MSDQRPHDLVRFMRNVTQEINSEYKRIYSRTKEDPGTARDEGEENWADLLRDWLLSSYKIVTKGRILSRNNKASPQVDVLILKPSYPQKLINKKHYLAAGVIAAFECKNTLRKGGLRKTMKNAAELSQILKDENQANYYLEKYRDRDTSYIELHRPILYGLLAHSQDFNSDDDKSREKISSLIKKFDQEIYKHPRELIDVICVADLAVWRTQRTPYSLVHLDKPDKSDNPFTPKLIANPETCYTCHHKGVWGKDTVHYKSTTPIGSFFTALYKKLSYKDPNLEEWARYFTEACKMGIGGGDWRIWDINLSPESMKRYDLTNPYNSNWGMDTFD